MSPQADDQQFKNFHRQLCERFGYCHDEEDWRRDQVSLIEHIAQTLGAPIPAPMLLWCPECGERHVDVGEFATKIHHTHACQSCGMVWRPSVHATVGVQWLPGFKNRGDL